MTTATTTKKNEKHKYVECVWLPLSQCDRMLLYRVHISTTQSESAIAMDLVSVVVVVVVAQWH